MNSARISKHYKKINRNVEIFQMSLDNHISNLKQDSKTVFSSNSCNLQHDANSQTSDSSIEGINNPSNTRGNIEDLFGTDDTVLGSVLGVASNEYNYSSGSSSSAHFNIESDVLADEFCQEPDDKAGPCTQRATSHSPSLISQLSEWAINYNITHVAINELLKILKSSHPELPSDARTLMHTPRSIILKDEE